MTYNVFPLNYVVITRFCLNNIFSQNNIVGKHYFYDITTRKYILSTYYLIIMKNI